MEGAAFIAEALGDIARAQWMTLTVLQTGYMGKRLEMAFQVMAA